MDNEELAILVVDMPKSCSECKMLYRKRNNKREVYRCQILKTNLQVDKIDNHCPLKPIPKKKDEHMKFGSWEVTYSINVRNMGYNDALKDILGETE